MEPNQTPTYAANVPEDLTGDGAMAAELAALYFGEPMPGQPHLLDVMLARDSHDKFAAPEVGISCLLYTSLADAEVAASFKQVGALPAGLWPFL